MKTKTKIFLASTAYRAISGVRALAGRGRTATVVRDGVRWDLDLSEGIDFSIYLLGCFERSTRNALHELARPGDTVFDIGANIGAHTLPLARHVGACGRVFAFEPTDFAFSKLTKNIALNPDLRARIGAHQVLLTDQPATPVKKEIYSSWPLTPANEDSVHPKHRGRLSTTNGASPDTLDAFVNRERIDRLDLIKIDVDGNEFPVLHGGEETLRSMQPCILMELSPYVHVENGNSFASLIDLLRSVGYLFTEVGSGRGLPRRADELERMIPDGSSINAIARIDAHP